MNTSSLLKKILPALTGVAIVEIISKLYDYFIYPVVTYYFGEKIWLSFLVLFVGATLINYILVLAYDRYKKDLFGFESIKKIKEDAHNPNVEKTKLERRILRFERYGTIPLFLFLAWYDPFLAVLYKRKTSEFKGFTGRDYVILLLCTFFGCAIWSGMWSWVDFLKK